MRINIVKEQVESVYSHIVSQKDANTKNLREKYNKLL